MTDPNTVDHNKEYDNLCERIGRVDASAEQYMRTNGILLDDFEPSARLSYSFVFDDTPHGNAYWLHLHNWDCDNHTLIFVPTVGEIEPVSPQWCIKRTVYSQEYIDLVDRLEKVNNPAAWSLVTEIPFLTSFRDRGNLKDSFDFDETPTPGLWRLLSDQVDTVSPLNTAWKIVDQMCRGI